MKPIIPHAPFDDQIVAALHGDLSPEERAQFESRLQSDPAAQAAYQEAQAMHDLLEKTHRAAQPDPDFEQRMVSGVRRKLAQPTHRETAWESVLFFWNGAKRLLGGRSLWTYGGAGTAVLVVCLAMLIALGNQTKSVFTTITGQLAMASSGGDMTKARLQNEIDDLHVQKTIYGQVEPSEHAAKMAAGAKINYPVPGSSASSLEVLKSDMPASPSRPMTRIRRPMDMADTDAEKIAEQKASDDAKAPSAPAAPTQVAVDGIAELKQQAMEQKEVAQVETLASPDKTVAASSSSAPEPETTATALRAPLAATTPAAPAAADALQMEMAQNQVTQKASRTAPAAPVAAATPAPQDDRKLIRNAQLDLEVKSFQSAFDQITALTRAAGGYVDTSNSQRGGNGKLQGTVVVKILPPELDAFLLKLRDLGEVQNQSVSTDDVTKDYFDTQARLVNSQKMEAQLQELLKRENGKVADLLAVERELGRVRGEIEQMQGQLKLYDFQVQYATVTMNVAEKDLRQTAAYLLKELDDFSLYATDVEGTFNKARTAASDFKGQVLVADLKHNSGSDVFALMVVSVPPDQIEPFLAQIRALGRVANFTRDTKRVPKDGGDTNQPADQTATESDKVTVNIAIRSDDESRKQVAMTVVVKAVDEALDHAKTAALAQPGVEILGSSLNKAPQGASTAQLTVRVPGKDYDAVMDAFRSLGRASSLTIQRKDNSGPGASGDDAPVIVSLSLTDEETPVQTTDLTLVTPNVDDESQQIKKDAAAAGVDVKSASFEGQPNGTHLARLTLVLPINKYSDYLETLKKQGRVQSLTVQRNDVSGTQATEEDAPVMISLALTDDDPPVQVTQVSITASDVDAQSQQIKKEAATAGVQVKASNFNREPDGTEHAEMTLRLPMGKYPAYLESLKRAGKVESLSVERQDRPDLPAVDDTAPVEISLQLHNERAIVADNVGLWSTLRDTFGRGATALFGSITVIGVLLAFLAPWVFTGLLFAWIGRRIYVWRKNR